MPAVIYLQRELPCTAVPYDHLLVVRLGSYGLASFQVVRSAVARWVGWPRCAPDRAVCGCGRPVRHKFQWPGCTQLQGLAAVGRPEGVTPYRHRVLGLPVPGSIPAAAEGRLARTG